MSGKILITRPEDDSLALAGELQAMGYETLIDPMLHIHPVSFTRPDLSLFDGLVFTSRHALNQFAPHVQAEDKARMRVLTVGAQTAALAENFGFARVEPPASRAAELRDTLAQARTPDRLLYIRGAHISTALPVTQEVCVYAAQASNRLKPATAQSLKDKKIEAALFFSRRSLSVFAGLLEHHDLGGFAADIKALSISDSVLEYAYMFAETYTAASPDTKGMIRLVRLVVPD